MAKEQGGSWTQSSDALRFYSNSRRAARIAYARRKNEFYDEFGEDYQDWTKQELYEKAKEKDVPGRSNMNKEDLIRALRRY